MLTGPALKAVEGDKKQFIEKVRRALYLGKIVSYAQGFQQLKAASDEYNWDLTTVKSRRFSVLVVLFVLSSCKRLQMPTMKTHRLRTCY